MMRYITIGLAVLLCACHQRQRGDASYEIDTHGPYGVVSETDREIEVTIAIELSETFLKKQFTDASTEQFVTEGWDPMDQKQKYIVYGTLTELNGNIIQNIDVELRKRFNVVRIRCRKNARLHLGLAARGSLRGEMGLVDIVGAENPERREYSYRY